MSSNNDLTVIYQKKKEKEHILDNPDTYTGSMEKIDLDSYVLDKDGNIVPKQLKNIIMGLYKLFDEGIVNCRDHYIRTCVAKQNGIKGTDKLTYINVSISEDDIITFENDGNGIDVVEHPEYKVWIPEMIFYHLRTGTNYNKNEKKIVGGKNGFGSKLIFIWSTWGLIETVDKKRGLKYTQECSDNLDIIGKPKIEKYKGKPYTKISFKLDFERLKMTKMTDDMKLLFKRRIYDIAAVTGKEVKVHWNSELIPVKHFQQYIELYLEDKNVKKLYEKFDERWEYAVCLSPSDEFQQISFVNGIFTSKGGKHVDYILNQIVRKLQAFIQKKKKVEVKPTTIKEQLMLFVRCDINNPSFDSQTKDFMSTAVSNFGSTCTVSDKFIEKIAKLGVMDTATSLTEIKKNKTAKKTDGNKTRSIRGIPKLIDANFAGTNKSDKCTIIFCEGDSAKAGIVSGLSKEDRNYIGIYPMKGKLFNVRGETLARISENKEIVEIKQILGLETGKVYETIEELSKNLRYSKILFMTDQDLDGSHIKGLGLNLFNSLWNSILKLGIIGFMNTPILKGKKGKQEIMFYNDGEYEDWKKQNDVKSWTIKYYKGLGTSTSKEFKEYFEHKKIVNFKHTEQSSNYIDMVFNKKRSDDRKTWLGDYDRNQYLDTNKEEVNCEEFIDKELRPFSKYDCDRSICNIMDGKKISQRKILFAAFKRKLYKEIKVAQFSGYVSEHSCYHHGEASLNGAIVNMSQDYVGSNNINLLMPNGQFGTRLTGGKDSASERYIFTELNPLTRFIFNEVDDNILEYLDDDGTMVEPKYYIPIIPMVLVNGSKGIGTGFSSDIMCYNPNDIVKYIKNKLTKNNENIKINPYYEGFKGTIKEISKTKYLIKGVYEKLDDNTIRITELPIGTWIDDYKQFLESMLDNATNNKKTKSNCYIKDYVDMSTDKIVDFTVTFQKDILIKLENNIIDNECNQLEKVMKLYTTNTNTNMNLFDANDKLKLYKTVEDIIDDFYNCRITYYQKRKDFIILNLKNDLKILKNKVNYIVGILDDNIILKRKKKDEIILMLKEMNFDILENDSDYKYLLNMPMISLSEENVDKLKKEKEVKEKELDKIESTEINELWINDLELFEEKYNLYKNKRELAFIEDNKNKKDIKVKKVKKRLKMKNK